MKLTRIQELCIVAAGALVIGGSAMWTIELFNKPQEVPDSYYQKLHDAIVNGPVAPQPVENQCEKNGGHLVFESGKKACRPGRVPAQLTEEDEKTLARLVAQKDAADCHARGGSFMWGPNTCSGIGGVARDAVATDYLKDDPTLCEHIGAVYAARLGRCVPK